MHNHPHPPWRRASGCRFNRPVNALDRSVSFIDLFRSLYERTSVERSDPAAIASLHYGRGQSAGSAFLSYTGQRDLLVSRRRFRQVDLARRRCCLSCRMQGTWRSSGARALPLGARRACVDLVCRAGSCISGAAAGGRISSPRRWSKIVPAGGFGNLIALLLQHSPRLSGNSLFVDANFEPLADQ